MILDVGVYTFCYTRNIFLVTFDFTIFLSHFLFVQPCEKVKGMFDFSICLCYTCNILLITFVGYAETIFYYVDGDGIYALFESKNLQIAGRNTSFFRKRLS